MKILAAGLLLISQTASAISFDYETRYWFKDIKAECRVDTCKVYINGKHDGNYKYIVKNNIAEILHPTVYIEINLLTGDFKYKGK